MSAPARRILLAEDDRFLRKAAEATLTREGFQVVTAGDGEEALAAARAAPPPQLILLDLIMPKLHGFDVLKALKDDPATAAIPVIVLSNLGQEGDVERALAAGAVAYFIKANVSLKGLVQQVNDTLARSAS
jgi:CheY-like chemotaxis protein